MIKQKQLRSLVSFASLLRNTGSERNSEDAIMLQMINDLSSMTRREIDRCLKEIQAFWVGDQKVNLEFSASS